MFLETKLQQQQEQKEAQDKTHVMCSCQPKKKPEKITKPKPSGKEITEDTYVNNLNNYEQNKENIKPKKTAKQQPKQKSQTTKTTSPKQSTSGLTIKKSKAQITLLSDTESEYESEADESSLCCVCKKSSPPT